MKEAPVLTPQEAHLQALTPVVREYVLAGQRVERDPEHSGKAKQIRQQLMGAMTNEHLHELSLYREWQFQFHYQQSGGVIVNGKTK